MGWQTGEFGSDHRLLLEERDSYSCLLGFGGVRGRLQVPTLARAGKCNGALAKRDARALRSENVKQTCGRMVIGWFGGVVRERRLCSGRSCLDRS
jgi:hypothetical protein